MFKSIYLPQTPLLVFFLPDSSLPFPFHLPSSFFSTPLLFPTALLTSFLPHLLPVLEFWFAVNMAASPGASPALGELSRVLHGFSTTLGP